MASFGDGGVGVVVGVTLYLAFLSFREGAKVVASRGIY